MKYWYFKINGKRLRMKVVAKAKKPVAKQIGDQAWQIGTSVILENDGRLIQL